MLPDLASLTADHVFAVVVLDAADAANEIFFFASLFVGIRDRAAEEEGHEVWRVGFLECAS